MNNTGVLNNKRDIKSLLSEFKVLIGLIILILIISILEPRFLSPLNILNVLRQTSINAIIAAGMTFVILTGGIDLSVGSTLAFSGATLATLFTMGVSPVIAIILSLLLGTLLGCINGLFISYGKLQAFITTLVSMSFLRGATYVLTDGKPINMLDGNNLLFDFLGSGTFLGIPIPIYLMAGTYIICYFTLNHTKFGRYVYALGGNEEATRLSGINIDKVKIKVYALSGLFAALAGVILTSRLLSAQPNSGNGYELDAIAAVVLGGTSLSGGRGRITSTIIGALIIGVLNNSLNLLNVSSYYQTIVKALVILFAVLLDRNSKK